MLTKNQRSPFVLLCSMFFLCGFSTVLNTVLAPYLKEALSLSFAALSGVYISFYLAYLIVSPLAGSLLQKVKFAMGFRVSLMLSFLGALLIALGGKDVSYRVILIGVFVMAAGISSLQVTANPYIVHLGGQKPASSRLTFLQGFFALGAIAAPLFGSHFILSYLDDLPLPKPYLLLSLTWGLVWILMEAFPFPKLNLEKGQGRPLKEPVVRIGMVLVAAAVGVEVTAGNYVIYLLTDEKSLNLTLGGAGKIAMLYWIGFMLGRFTSSYFLQFYDERKVLYFHSMFGALLGVIACLGNHVFSSIAALLMGAACSALFPILFTLIMRESRSAKMKVSGYLMMANIGGGLIPLIQGFAADTLSLKLSFLIPTLCYLSIALFSKKAYADSDIVKVNLP